MRDLDRTLRVILRAVWVGVVLLVAATPSVTSQSSGPTSVQFGKNIRLTVNLDQEETAIAANPLNAANLVAVSQGPLGRPTPRACDFVFTTNGGKSWMFGGSAPLERSGDTCADPAIAADGQGNFYFAHLDFLISGGVVTESDVLVAKSTDGGQTFPAFTVAVNQDPKDPRSPDPDKEFVAVDTGTASAFRGTIYVAYTDLGNIQGDQIEAVISRDGGATWSLPAVIAAPAANEKAAVTRAGALPVVAADGTVYVFYAEFPSPASPAPVRSPSRTRTRGLERRSGRGSPPTVSRRRRWLPTAPCTSPGSTSLKAPASPTTRTGHLASTPMSGSRSRGMVARPGRRR